MNLSIVIPSYKDPALVKTIRACISACRYDHDTEIIVVMDGYRPKAPLPETSLIKYVFLPKNVGMRGAINAGISLARGKYVMKVDEHCMFAPGFDQKMIDACPERGLVTAVRHSLDPIKWKRMKGTPTFYEKLIIHEGRFVGVRWRSRDRVRREVIDENMAMQGSCYLMRRDWWDKLGILQEDGYGSFAQEAPEILFKTWKNGGRLMLAKNTWYAHKHRSFGRTRHIGSAITSPGNAYALATWKEYYEQEIKPRWFNEAVGDNSQLERPISGQDHQ